MRTPLIATTDAAVALSSEAHSWIGTPFAKGGGAKGKGGGVDCIHLVSEVFARAVGTGRIAFPEYTLDEQGHTHEPRLERYLDAHPQLLKIAALHEDVKRKALLLDGLPLRHGDLIGFRVGNEVHHLGIAVGGRAFIHCVRRMGTILSYCDDATFERRIMVVYRPMTL